MMKTHQFDSNQDWVLHVADEMVSNNFEKCSISFKCDDDSVSCHNTGLDFHDTEDVMVTLMPMMFMTMDHTHSWWSLIKNVWRVICIYVDMVVWKYRETKGGDISD